MFVRLNENLSIFLDFFLKFEYHCPTDRESGVSECKQPLFTLIRNHMSLLRCISCFKKAFLFSIFLFFILTPNPTLAGCNDGGIISVWDNDFNIPNVVLVEGPTSIGIRLGRCYKAWKGCSIYHCSTTKKQMYDRIVKELKLMQNAREYPPGVTYCIRDRSFEVNSSLFGPKKTEVVSSWGVPECIKF